MKLRAILLALVLVACGQTGEKGAPAAPAASEELSPANLHIEIGRAGAMLSTVVALTRERPGNSETDVTAPPELARALRENVWEYNLVRSQLCAKGLFTEASCGPVYEPVWISEPANAELTLEEINTRARAVHVEVQRLWATVCDDARSRVEDEQEKMYVCPME